MDYENTYIDPTYYGNALCMDLDGLEDVPIKCYLALMRTMDRWM